MFDMTFVLYCDDEQLWPRVCDLVDRYSPLFSATIVVLNTLEPKKIMAQKKPRLTTRLTTICSDGGLMMGSALNKMLVQITTERFFLYDPRYMLTDDFFQFLQSLPQAFFIDTTVCLSLQPCYLLKSWALNWPSQKMRGELYGFEVQYVPLLCWGALLLSVKAVARLGGFDQQLSFDALMIDMSWRLQTSAVALAQVLGGDFVALKPLKKAPHFSLKDTYLLCKKYPQIYPKYLSKIRNFFKTEDNNAHSTLF